MREVARRTGCTHQAPYHYFANREAVLAELVREGFDELVDQLAAAREGVGDADLRAILTASGIAYVEFALRHPGVFRVMFRPDVCDFERFPEVVQAGERARNELARMARSMVGGEASLEVEVCSGPAFMAWPCCCSTAPWRASSARYGSASTSLVGLLT